MDNGIEGLARAWAFEAHKDQAYGPHSYRYHLEKVVDKVSEYSRDSDLISAAYLHDGPEDTDMTIAEIRAKISFDCGEIVHLVTDPAGYDNRKARKSALYQQFRDYKSDAASNHSAEIIKEYSALVKGADRWCNHAESIETSGFGTMRMYTKEFPEFIRVFGAYINFPLYMELFDQYNVMQIILREHNK